MVAFDHLWPVGLHPTQVRAGRPNTDPSRRADYHRQQGTRHAFGAYDGQCPRLWPAVHGSYRAPANGSADLRQALGEMDTRATEVERPRVEVAGIEGPPGAVASESLAVGYGWLVGRPQALR